MAKLTNGFEYNNPNLPPSFGEYLLQNGFDVKYLCSAIIFSKQEKKLYVRGTSIDFMIVHPGGAGESSYQSGYVGLDHLDINGFVLLMHIMHVQDLREYEINASTIDHQHKVEARLFTGALILSLQNLKHEPAACI